jgi:hypothetical protein
VNRDFDIARLSVEIEPPLVPEVHENGAPESAERRDVETDVSMRRSLTDLLSGHVKFYERMRGLAINQVGSARSSFATMLKRKLTEHWRC